MKKLSLVLALLLLFTFIGCGSENKEPEVMKTENCEIQLLKCEFADEISGQDTEYRGSGYPKSNNNVYVDLVLRIKYMGEGNFAEDDISAYFMYLDRRFDMFFEVESSSGVSLSDDSYISSQETAIVHMFNKVDKAIIEEDITVFYTVEGVNFEAKVVKAEKADPLSAKTKVKVGDKVNCNNLYEFEVISCEAKEHLMASDTENSEIYRPFGGNDLQFVDMVLKIKNNTQTNLNGIFVYTYINDEFVVGAGQTEADNNTTIKSLNENPLGTGEEGIFHLYVVINKSDNTNGLMIRFNLGGNCYYCEIEK